MTWYVGPLVAVMSNIGDGVARATGDWWCLHCRRIVGVRRAFREAHCPQCGRGGILVQEQTATGSGARVEAILDDPE